LGCLPRPPGGARKTLVKTSESQLPGSLNFWAGETKKTEQKTHAGKGRAPGTPKAARPGSFNGFWGKTKPPKNNKEREKPGREKKEAITGFKKRKKAEMVLESFKGGFGRKQGSRGGSGT